MSAIRTERLLNLLTLLLNTRRPISLRDLREMDEFTAYATDDPKSGERAFERDKAALLELGVPLHWIPPEQDAADEDGLGGYVIDRDKYFLPELNLNPDELALLSMAGAAAAGIEGFPGRSAVIRALAKLGFDVDESQIHRSLAHAPIREARDPKRVAEHLQLLHDAVALKRTVSMRYTATGAEATERNVDPYGLFYRHGAWYLVGWCHLRQAERTFHLGRIEELRLTFTDRQGNQFEVPKNFQLSMYVHARAWELPHESSVTVTIKLDQRLQPAIPELFGQRAVVETRKDAVYVTVQVTNKLALIAAVLPLGADAEVVSPPKLRQEICSIYAALCRQYQHLPPGELADR